MQFITAGPMDYSPEIREGVIAAGVAQAKTLASTFA